MKKKYQIFSGSGLKALAVIVMLIDHTAFVLLGNYAPACQPLFCIGGHAFSLYLIMRYIGRMAFPIFAFLLVEGFIHTSNRKKYGYNLLIFAFLSELPWNYVHTGNLFYSGQNVFFTLFFGFLGLCAIEYFHRDRTKLLFSLVGLLMLSILFHADYGCSGFGFILLMYVLREEKLIQAVIGSCFLSSRWIAGIAFIPINLYNGKRGFIKGKVVKYGFYAFYPLHMLLLGILRHIIYG